MFELNNSLVYFVYLYLISLWIIEIIGFDVFVIGDIILCGLISWILNFELCIVKIIIYVS